MQADGCEHSGQRPTDEPISDEEHRTLQDTNAPVPRQYSEKWNVLSRPASPWRRHLTPAQLMALGEVAKEILPSTRYITGGQRIDLFGVRVEGTSHPIWERLIAVGFESGHAYGKAMRTVKSCVGSTWCRFGVQDLRSAPPIRVEHRYKGILVPPEAQA